MLNIAILGFGTVGSGVAEAVLLNAGKLAEKAGQEINIKYIVDVRDMPESPFADKLVKDFSLVEKDPEVRVVVETIGGVRAAYEFTRRSLLAGKCVVTSNKELVATHGYELMKIAEENGVSYLFEAAVGGGIPLLRPIAECFPADEIQEIRGILNGTTNYILTEMIQNGVPQEKALKQAQKLGYAEANPVADLDGLDACRKICILSAMAFGCHIYPESVPTEGVGRVTEADVKFASMKAYKIKLLGRTLKDKEGKICASVAPCLIPESELIAHVDGVMNGISIRSNATGEVVFYGAGAGKMPTAAAVLADVAAAAKDPSCGKAFFWQDCSPELVGDADKLVTRWYIRVAVNEIVPGEKIGENSDSAAFITESADRAGAEKFAEGCRVQAMFRILT